MITQEQAERAVELLKEAPKILAIAMTKDIAAAEKVYGEWGLKRKKLLQEIEANKPTNGDRIRNMSDEELVKLFNEKMKCRGCKEEWAEWITQEAEQ